MYDFRGIKMFEKRYKRKDLFVAYAGMISTNRERDEIYWTIYGLSFTSIGIIIR